MNNPFIKKIQYQCDLRNETLVEFFKEWDRKGQWKNLNSLKLYFKKILNENEVVLSRFVDKVESSPDIYMKFINTDSKLNLVVKPAVRSYVLFLQIPIISIIIGFGESIKLQIIPGLYLVFLIFFFRWVAISEVEKIKKEIEGMFKRKGVNFLQLF